MQKFCLVSDKPMEEWAAELPELLETLNEYKVRGVAVIALLETEADDDADSVTAYYDMSLRDRQYAAQLINQDVIQQIVRTELRHLLDGDEEEDEE